MSDTQWRRFQVFVQEGAGLPYLDAGSVHAPDAELALLNARDVFARRPECSGMWVAPVEAIFSRTAEQILAQGIQPLGGRSSAGMRFYVFAKSRPGGTQALLGEVQAGSALQALRLALGEYSSQQAVSAWWVIPADQVTHSRPDDIESMYAPAQDKGFRLSTDFHTHSAMREIKKP